MPKEIERYWKDHQNEHYRSFTIALDGIILVRKYISDREIQASGDPKSLLTFIEASAEEEAFKPRSSKLCSQ